MSDLITDDDLSRARSDPDFRQQYLAQNLDRLEALNKLRKASEHDPDATRLIREGVDLAVKLADRLQQNGVRPGPRAA